MRRNCILIFLQYIARLEAISKTLNYLDKIFVGLSTSGIAEQRELYKVQRKCDYVQTCHAGFLLIVNECHMKRGCIASGPRGKFACVYVSTKTKHPCKPKVEKQESK